MASQVSTSVENHGRKREGPQPRGKLLEQHHRQHRVPILDAGDGNPGDHPQHDRRKRKQHEDTGIERDAGTQGALAAGAP